MKDWKTVWQVVTDYFAKVQTSMVLFRGLEVCVCWGGRSVSWKFAHAHTHPSTHISKQLHFPLSVLGPSVRAKGLKKQNTFALRVMM